MILYWIIMAVDFTRLITANLRVFGESFTFTRVESEDEGNPSTPTTITGIPSESVNPDSGEPFDSSMYFNLEIASDALATDPQKGDEIATSENVYVIHDITKNGAGGTVLHLRRDRDV
jgi:hypothetical protein